MSIGVAFFLLLIGLVHMIFPTPCWYMQIGWKIKEAEPSEAYIILSRVIGGMVSAISLIVIIVSFIQAGQQQAHALDGWNKFKKEMTVKNIVSIHEEYNNVKATPEEIKQFVQDLHGITARKYESNNSGQFSSFSATDSFQIKCSDGYQVSLINIDNNGNFGIASPNWLAPDYEFNSANLANWVQQFN